MKDLWTERCAADAKAMGFGRHPVTDICVIKGVMDKIINPTNFRLSSAWLDMKRLQNRRVVSKDPAEYAQIVDERVTESPLKLVMRMPRLPAILILSLVSPSGI